MPRTSAGMLATLRPRSLTVRRSSFIAKSMSCSGNTKLPMRRLGEWVAQVAAVSFSWRQFESEVRLSPVGRLDNGRRRDHAHVDLKPIHIVDHALGRHHLLEK